jgi:hypothetical protein
MVCRRSCAIVIGYLMKLRGWTLTESHTWVKDRHTACNLNQGALYPVSESRRIACADADHLDVWPLSGKLLHHLGHSLEHVRWKRLYIYGHCLSKLRVSKFAGANDSYCICLTLCPS